MTLDRHSVTSNVERESLEFLNRAQKLRGLSSMQFQRIENRLSHTIRPKRRRLLLPALAALFLVLIAGTAIAHGVDLSRLPIIGALFPARRQSPAAETPRPRQQPVRVPSVAATRAGVMVPTTPPVVIAMPSPIVKPVPVRTPTIHTVPRVTLGMTPTGPAGEPIQAESRSFSAALGKWHHDHDAKAALAALDVHERRFPSGQMQLEAWLLRAEIVLHQGREREGLALLDRMSLPALPRARELQTVRGELRVKYGRCTEGRQDLDDVLAKDSADGLARRAARAISRCP
jgi:hypothetical protein